jgi:stress response protein YsnF
MNNNQSQNEDNNKIQGRFMGSSTYNNNNNNFSYGEEIVKKIPLFAENFDITKKTEETQLILAKKWITSTKKIEIPIKYEEAYINGKEFDAYSENEIIEIFSKIKDKITDVFSHEKDKNKDSSEEISHSEDIEVIHHKNSNPRNEKSINSDAKLIPISIDKNNYNSKKEENVIPIWGEEIIINKKMVKLGEIIIKKYETNEKQKIEIDVKSEQLTIKYPDNHKEEII